MDFRLRPDSPLWTLYGSCGQIGAYDSTGCVPQEKQFSIPQRAEFLEIVGRNPAHNPMIRFGVREESRNAPVDLSIYDVAGRRVRRLYEGIGGEEAHAIQWDGCGDGGLQVASGIYFARLRVGSDPVKLQRVVVMR